MSGKVNCPDHLEDLQIDNGNLIRAPRIAASSHRPSSVGAVPQAMAERKIQSVTRLVAVLMTDSCGLVCAAVKTR